MSRYLNKKDVCEELGISIGKVDIMMKDGLKYSKFGRNVRFNSNDIEEYMNNKIIII